MPEQHGSQGRQSIEAPYYIRLLEIQEKHFAVMILNEACLIKSRNVLLPTFGIRFSLAGVYGIFTSV